MRKRVWYVIAGILIGAAAASSVFAVAQTRSGERFAAGTVIGGTDVSGMTTKDLEQQLERDYSLTVVYRDENGENVEETISGKEIGVCLGENEAELDRLLQEQGAWAYLTRQGKQYEFDDLLQYDREKLEAAIDRLGCFAADRFTEPEDAYISDYEKGKGYHIVPETKGNILDREKARARIMEAVDQMQERVELSEGDCYQTAQVTSEDAGLNRTLQKLNTYTGAKITYRFGKKTEILDGEQIAGWLHVNKKGGVKLDEKQVGAFVSELRRKYDTIFTRRRFRTSYGKTVTVTGGDYGWWMNTAAEQKALTGLIRKGERTERTPAYYQTAQSYGKKDYGNSYIEINLTTQHVFVYWKGKKVLETDCVTGNSSRGYDTPVGTYSITYTERDATLQGENYSTPVKYWMPFNRNIGLHDAGWRSSFGGEIYRYNGSHGCVNLPPQKAAKLFRYAKKGMPVFCYQLAVPKQKAPDKKAQAVQKTKKQAEQKQNKSATAKNKSASKQNTKAKSKSASNKSATAKNKSASKQSATAKNKSASKQSAKTKNKSASKKNTQAKSKSASNKSAKTKNKNTSKKKG